MGTGITPVTREEQFAGALSGDMPVEDLPRAETHVEKYLKYAAEHGGGGGGGFTPTDEQLAAMNSGITAEKLQADENDISSLQEKVVAHTAGGSNYDTINDIRVYVDSNPPTGARVGDLWIGG